MKENKLEKSIQLALNEAGIPVFDIHVHIIRDVLKQYASLSSQDGSGIVGFVNASERLPNLEITVVVRLDGETLRIGNFFQNNNKTFEFYVNYDPSWFIKSDKFSGIEWLDTTPLTLPVQDEWIEIKNRFPKLNVHNDLIEVSEEVQVFDKVLGVAQAWMKRFLVDTADQLFPEHKKGYWLFESTQYRYNNVTHWKPLPAPPKQ